jgi:hypothetical protein
VDAFCYTGVCVPLWVHSAALFGARAARTTVVYALKKRRKKSFLVRALRAQLLYMLYMLNCCITVVYALRLDTTVSDDCSNVRTATFTCRCVFLFGYTQQRLVRALRMRLDTTVSD